MTATYQPANSVALRRLADDLDRAKDELLEVYARRTSLSRAEIAHLMTVEGEFHGAAAVEVGLADLVLADRRLRECPVCGQVATRATTS